jgi:hypothetical protein
MAKSFQRPRKVHFSRIKNGHFCFPAGTLPRALRLAAISDFFYISDQIGFQICSTEKTAPFKILFKVRLLLPRPRLVTVTEGVFSQNVYLTKNRIAFIQIQA